MNRFTHRIYDLIIGMYYSLSKQAFIDNKTAAWAKQRGKYYVQKPIKQEDSEVVFFCSSHGEFEIIRELLITIRKNLPSCYIHLLFFSGSGYQFVINETWAYDRISIAPLDKSTVLESFFHDQVPKSLFITANAIWPSLIAYFQNRKLPYFFINSSFNGRRDWSKATYFQLMKRYLIDAKHIYVDNKKSQEYLESIGAVNSQTILNLRWDALLAFKENVKPIIDLDRFRIKEKKLLVCGSTYREDEALIARALTDQKDYSVIIAPHHVSKSRISEIRHLFPTAVLFNELSNEEIPTVMVVDQIGLLKSLYQYADVAYVGGAFNNALHNVLEAAVWEIPVLFSPLSNKGTEVKAIEACGIGKEVDDAAAFSNILLHIDEIKLNPCYSDNTSPSGLPLIMKEIKSIVR